VNQDEYCCTAKYLFNHLAERGWHIYRTFGNEGIPLTAATPVRIR
jgi:hypothetical protein